MFNDYRSKHHYDESNSGGFLLVLIGGAVLGTAVPIITGCWFRAHRVQRCGCGVVIWLVLTSRYLSQCELLEKPTYRA